MCSCNVMYVPSAIFGSGDVQLKNISPHSYEMDTLVRLREKIGRATNHVVQVKGDVLGNDLKSAFRANVSFS